MDVEQKLISLSEAARILNVSHVQMWRLVNANKVPVVRIDTGNRPWYGVRREAVEAYQGTRRKPGRPKDADRSN